MFLQTEKPKRKDKIFADIIHNNEEIMWRGQPNPSRHFNRHDLYLIPFNLIWGGFVFLWASNALVGGATFLFILWGIPFVLAGLYGIFGRFIYKYFKKLNTYYAVTDDRVIILEKLWSNKITSFYIADLTMLNRNGPNITFDSFHQKRWGRRSWDITNTGMELMHGNETVPGFYDLRDADEVYELIQNVRHWLKTHQNA